MLQYAAGMALSLGLLNKIWNLHDSFGLVLATGYYGGHGTAVALGEMYKDMGYPEFLDLGNTSATVGLVGGIIVGMILINWGTRKKYTNFVDSPKDLPNEIKKGVIPRDKQKSSGNLTVSNMSLDSLVFHLSIALFTAYLGRLASVFIKSKVSWLSIPVFVLALAAGYIVQGFIKVTGAQEYIAVSYTHL